MKVTFKMYLFKAYISLVPIIVLLLTIGCDNKREALGADNEIRVYDATDLSNPILKQILPSGIAPEGLKAIPSRNLFVTSNEKDKKVRGNLTIFQF